MSLRSGRSATPHRPPAPALDEDAAEALARRLLATRDRSRAELTRRLLRAGAPAGVAARVAAGAASRGWADDSRLADSLVRRSLERGYGGRRLSADLRARGVDREVAAEALREAESRRVEALSRAAERLLGRRTAGPLDAAAARRLAAALRRRGFGSAEIRDLVRHLAGGDADPAKMAS